MKYISLITTVFAGMILLSCEKEISVSQSESFLKMYGSKGIDKAKGIAVLENGGYAICGTDSSGQGTKMMLIVTDEYGNLLEGFPKYYPEGELNAGANAIVAKNGGKNGFLLCGYIEDENGDKDIFIVKTSAAGGFIWSESYGSSEDEEALHAAEGITYEFILAGYQEKDGEKDVMVMAVDQDLDSIPLSLNYSKPANSKDAAANYILNQGDHYLCVATYNMFIGEGTKILILDFDDDLSPNSKVLGGDFDQVGKCIVYDGGNEFVVLGNSYNTQTGNSEILLYSVEAEGLIVRNDRLLATISESGADLRAERMVKVDGDRYAIVGTRSTNGDSDIFVQFMVDFKKDIDKTFGSAGIQAGADIAIAGNGGLVILGDNGFEGNSMISLIKTDESGNF
ncbi:MAG: hypothetical protein R6W31_18875 [Bacteroidales bacterium]